MTGVYSVDTTQASSVYALLGDVLQDAGGVLHCYSRLPIRQLLRYVDSNTATMWWISNTSRTDRRPDHHGNLGSLQSIHAWRKRCCGSRGARLDGHTGGRVGRSSPDPNHRRLLQVESIHRAFANKCSGLWCGLLDAFTTLRHRIQPSQRMLWQPYLQHPNQTNQSIQNISKTKAMMPMNEVHNLFTLSRFHPWVSQARFCQNECFSGSVWVLIYRILNLPFH